jgi:hypothetical protein
MQLLVQVVCTPGKSLRESIAKHPRITEHGLTVSQQKNPERSNGWMKIHSTRADRDGAINVQWDSNASILMARIVTRGRGDSSLIAGDLVAFLLRRFKSRVHSIIVVPRR